MLKAAIRSRPYELGSGSLPAAGSKNAAPAKPAADSAPIPAAAAASGDAVEVARLAQGLAAISRHPWTLMEVCGGQTHTILRWGLDQLLPPGLRLIHGPGCPVCVTPAETIEQALNLARRPEVILCSYGDMLRVPGLGRDDLLAMRAEGGDVRLLTSPLQALRIAANHPDRQVVFLAVGFETTAPATALLARQALAHGIGNLSLLNAHVRVAPAMQAILAEPGNQVQGFLAAGHVCAVLGTAELQALVARWHVPVVVSGFAAPELLAALHACVSQLEAGVARLENAYGSVVQPGGNGQAQQLLAEVFRPCDRHWRGLGDLAGGGLALAGVYQSLDARMRFGLPAELASPAPASGFGKATAAGDGCCANGACPAPAPLMVAAAVAAAPPGSWSQAASSEPPGEAPDPLQPPPPCIAGTILRGQALPLDCPAFGGACTPEQPLGAPMVSGEGACAAYYRYRPGAELPRPLHRRG